MVACAGEGRAAAAIPPARSVLSFVLDGPAYQPEPLVPKAAVPSAHDVGPIHRCAEDPQGLGDDDGSAGVTSTSTQPKSSTQEHTNQGSLLIDANCAPVDIRLPTDI